MNDKTDIKDASRPLPRWRRRRYQIAAGSCAALALAGGAVVVAQQGGFHALGHVFGLGTNGPGAGALPGSGQPDPLAGGLGRTSARPSPGSTPRPGAPGSPGRPTQPGHPSPGRPSHPAPSGATATTRSVVINGISATQVDSGSMPGLHHTMRVVSAYGDLWGMRELAWVADAGEPVGGARCTQNFHIGATPTRVRPTLMICWRTSATRSVYTVAVDIDHRPSALVSAALVAQVWNSLG